MRKHKTVIFLTLGFLVGVCILLYPAFSDFWNSKTQSHAIVNYESVLENIEPQDYSAIFEKAYAYNEKLYRTNNPLLNHNEIPGYYEALSISDDGMIGYLQIDRIGVELPVYHGTSEEVLGRGVGHLEGSSLPVGEDWGNASKHPCRLSGSIYDRTIQVGATTQKGQYDFYRDLSLGDTLIFTDMEGNRFTYEIKSMRYEKHADRTTLACTDADFVLFIKNLYAFDYLIIFCGSAN